MDREHKPMMIRLPADVKSFVEAQADRNGASQNSEIIRALRERMDRVTTQDLTGGQGTDRT